MFGNFLWVSAKKIPYEGYFFLEPEDEILLQANASLEEIEEFFKILQSKVKKGFYALGFLTYELGYLFEKRLLPLFRKSDLPLAHFVLFKTMQKKLLFPMEGTPLYKIESLIFDLTFEEYLQAIQKIKKYIASGDTYQVNFTAKFKFTFQGDPWELFWALLFSQRCEYACFFRTPSYTLLSLSPELFLQKKGDRLYSAPMKGTIKRGFRLEDDQRKRRILRGDLKTRAENVMILDLLRNDLGRVSKAGSVWAKEVFKIKTYPSLHQMISGVTGRLKSNSLFEIMQALFPCGSVTGAPKIRTMEIIAELEKEPRNLYTGAMGYITPEGDFTFNVAIRSAYLKPINENFYTGELGVGAGIVWDSNPRDEYEETRLKANFFLCPLPYFKLFETFLWGKDFPGLYFHYQRLKRSAKFFAFKIPEELKSFERFHAFLKENLPQEDFPLRVRFTLSPEGKTEFFVKKMDAPCWAENLKVGLVKRKNPRSVFHFHKTTQREEYDLWRERAQALGFNEIIFYNEKTELLEGTISNVFVKIGDKYLTPPVELGLLPGVLREALIKEGLAKEEIIKIENLAENEFWIGNSLRGLGKVKEWVIL